MDARRVDALAQVLSRPDSRRRLLGLLPALLLPGGALSRLSGDAAARKRRKKKCKPRKQATVCAGTCGPVTNRQTCGKTIDCGPCACTPSTQCPADYACGTAPDGCGGTLECGSCDDPTVVCTATHVCGPCTSHTECGANEICVEGVCQACDVTCNGHAGDCGTALQAALGGSASTLYVCPGAYRGGFSIDRSVTVIGAGAGANPAGNTVLDGNGTQRVQEVSNGPVVLQRLRITGGDVGADSGGGIVHYGTSSLTMYDCSVAGNRGRTGGGIAHASGTLAMTRRTVRDNVAPAVGGLAFGGGMYITGTATLANCLITNNTTAGAGGGVTTISNVVSLAGTTVIRGNRASQGGGLFTSPQSSLTIDEAVRITGNRATAADSGGGIENYGVGNVTLLGADPSRIVVNNCPDNCLGQVPKCAATPVSCPP